MLVLFHIRLFSFPRSPFIYLREALTESSRLLAISTIILIHMAEQREALGAA